MRDFNFGQIDRHLPESSKVFDLRSIFMKIIHHSWKLTKHLSFELYLVARAWGHRGRKVLLSQQATCAACAVFLNDNCAASRGLRGAFLPHARAIGVFLSSRSVFQCNSRLLSVQILSCRKLK